MESFINERVMGILDVNMKQEIASYKETEGKKPTIVFDLRSLKSKMFESDREILLGGRYNILYSNIFYFFHKLKCYGTNLVFFVDGPMQEIAATLREKNVEYSEAIGVLNDIHEGLDLDTIAEKEITQAPGFLSMLLSFALYHGEIRRTNLNHFNIEIGSFASENRVLAIISNDMDLLFFEGSWHLWSSNIDLKKMSTKQYNREHIFKSLELSGKQIQVFCALKGNAILSSETMKDFYRNLQRLHYGSSHFIGMIELVKCLLRDSQTVSSINVWILSRLIFPSAQQHTGLVLLQDSIESYDRRKCVREYEDELKKEAAKSTFNYIILSNIPYVAEVYYFDLSKTDFMPFYDIISPVIRRIMGILLYDTKICVTKGRRSIFCKTSHNEGYKEIFEMPEYPDIEVPKILTLLTEPMRVDPNLDTIRYKLICWALSKELNSAAVQELPTTNLLDVLTLFYLCELKQITVEEADCILISCIYDDQDEPTMNSVTRINGRDAQIAFLFPVFRTYVKRVLRAVGIGKVVCGTFLLH